MNSPLDRVRTTLHDEVDTLRKNILALSETELIEPTGCAGWRVADLIAHLRGCCEAFLVGLVSLTDDPADRNFASIWRDWPAGAAPTFAEVRSTWAITASYATSADLRGHFDVATTAVARAALTAPSGRVRFHGRVMDIDDYLAMWTVEFALHHLDLLPEARNRSGPIEGAIDLAALTVDGLLPSARPVFWDTLTYVLKGTGRIPLDVSDRSRLGLLAFSYPVLA